MNAIFKALSDCNRLRIIHLLLQRELCVCEIEVILDLNQSNVSRNLRVLRNQAMVVTEKEAQWIHYKMDLSFMKKNAYLMKYLKEKFAQSKVFQKDLEKFRAYEDNNFSCQSIGDYREKVVEMINL